MSSDQSHKAAGNGSQASKIGWASGVSLALAYTLFFSAITALILGIAYHYMAETIRDNELQIVRNRAAEYRAWLQRGNIKELEARMNEQSMQSGDIIFARVTGPNHNYVKSLAPGGDPIYPHALNDLDSRMEGYGIELGNDTWVVVSIPVDDSGTILQAGKNTRSSSATLGRLRRIFTLAFIPAIVVAATGGAFLTYRRLAPIRTLIAVMQDIIRSGDMNRRVDPVGRGNELNALIKLFNKLLKKNTSLVSSMRHSLDSIAHDFRTPLSRINIIVQEALDNEPDPEALRDALADCIEESERMNHLLNSLMDVAEAESGVLQLDLAPCSVSDLIDSVVDLYEFVAEDKGIQLTVETPEEIRLLVDQTRIKQALANLVDNAIKFSPPNTTVRIASASENNICKITVQDEGQGISKNDLSRIWERLYRAERSRSTRGIGIGLSLVKAIVEAHGGDVSVSSQPDHGSLFTMQLPHPNIIT
ncbi:MAG: HAMP domain-containing histidine kinase [Akkermansiaceae bacterium]|nr:HAMP domain-containing histidine kinase [Akkermansiaceae bacterium]